MQFNAALVYYYIIIVRRDLFIGLALLLQEFAALLIDTC